MFEHLPWIIGGLVVGLFVGYAFGKYRGASQALGGPEFDRKLAEGRPQRAGDASSEGNSESTEGVYIRRGGGSHYHLNGCRHLRGRGYRVTKAAATKKGYKRCPSCRP